MDTNWCVIVVIIQCWIGKLVIWFSGHSHFWSMGDNYLCEGPDGCINSLDTWTVIRGSQSDCLKMFFLHSNRQYEAVTLLSGDAQKVGITANTVVNQSVFHFFKKKYVL